MNTTLRDDVQKVFETAAWCEQTGSGHLLVSGPDAANWLQRLLSQDILKVAVGSGAYAGLLDRKGMIQATSYVLRVELDAFHLISAPPLAEKMGPLLRRFKFMEKVELKDQISDWSFCHLMGPRVSQRLIELGVITSEPPPQQILHLPEGLLWLDSIYQKPVWHLLTTKASLPSFLNQIPPVGLESYEILRQESGIPRDGIDINEQNTLLEANMHYAYARFKGCYPGQEVMERILSYGQGKTPRVLKTFHFQGARDLPPGAPVKTEEGVAVGQMTSAVYNPYTDQMVVLGYVERKYEGVNLGNFG